MDEVRKHLLEFFKLPEIKEFGYAYVESQPKELIGLCTHTPGTWIYRKGAHMEKVVCVAKSVVQIIGGFVRTIDLLDLESFEIYYTPLPNNVINFKLTADKNFREMQCKVTHPEALDYYIMKQEQATMEFEKAVSCIHEYAIDYHSMVIQVKRITV